MLITKEDYLAWQKRLDSSNLFRRWWQFWSNYSVVFFVIAAIWLCLQPYRYQISLLVIIAFFVCRAVAVPALNLVYKKQRPYQKYSFIPITSRLLSFQTSVPNSILSRHVSVFASATAVILAFNLWIGAGLLVATLMTGAARIILGYHYLSDTIYALAVGLVVGFLLAYAVRPILFT